MRKAIKNTLLTLLIVVLCASTAYLAYLHFFAPDDEELSGEWIASLDVTERAAVTAYSWLRDIEGVSLTLEDMESRMPDLTIQVRLTLEQTARSEGTFQCRILQESYDACDQAAYEAFAGAFQELLTERLRMAGYTGDTDSAAVEELVAETFGMSTISYLMTCGPELLPPLEELQAGYDGSGVYETSEGVLTRVFDDGRPNAARQERYIRQGPDLVLSGGSDAYPLIYTLEPDMRNSNQEENE